MTGRKFERFLFDLFPRADDVIVCGVERDREFAPLKNAEGADSPDEVRAALDRQYRRWHAEAEVPVPEDEVLAYSPLTVNGPDDLPRP